MKLLISQDNFVNNSCVTQCDGVFCDSAEAKFTGLSGTSLVANCDSSFLAQRRSGRRSDWIFRIRGRKLAIMREVEARAVWAPILRAAMVLPAEL